jgi:hypothetical protein
MLSRISLALIRATHQPFAGIKKRTQGPAILQIAPGVGSPGGAEHSTRAKIHFFFDFLAFFALAFFAFFAFLAIVSSQGFHGLKRDTEACLAEGQPRNILDDNPTRFGGRCRVPSWRCHHVIHSCYAF